MKTMNRSELSGSDDLSRDYKAIGAKMLADLAESDVIESAPPALQLLNRTLDDMTADLLENCLDGTQPERLTVFDVMELRQAIFSVNDFAGLLAAEKNSLTALVGALTGAASSKN